MKKEWKNQNLFSAVVNALNGIKYTIKTQRNIKIQLCFAILAIIIGFILKLSVGEWCILIITISLVFLSEFINTAIETVVDLYTQEYNEKAKNAKDVAAAGVLIMAISSVIIGIILFGTKIIVYMK